MDDERKREIMQRAYANIERRDDERRGPVDDREDALLKWQRLKAQSTEPPKVEPPKPQPKERAMSELNVLRADLDRHKREALAYREALEKAIGVVIAQQRKVHDELRAEITELRQRSIHRRRLN